MFWQQFLEETGKTSLDKFVDSKGWIGFNIVLAKSFLLRFAHFWSFFEVFRFLVDFLHY